MNQFRRFIVVYNRTYISSDEYKYRNSVFRSNVERMKKYDKLAGKNAPEFKNVLELAGLHTAPRGSGRRVQHVLLHEDEQADE